jgi:hypothetical protein
VPGGCDVGRERAQTGGSDRLYEGARVRLDGVDGFRVVRDRCLFFLSPHGEGRMAGSETCWGCAGWMG